MSNCSREAEVCRICCRIGQLEGAILRTLVAPEGLFPGYQDGMSACGRIGAFALWVLDLGTAWIRLS